jgi:hypothetical protein
MNGLMYIMPIFQKYTGIFGTPNLAGKANLQDPEQISFENLFIAHLVRF